MSGIDRENITMIVNNGVHDNSLTVSTDETRKHLQLTKEWSRKYPSGTQ